VVQRVKSVDKKVLALRMVDRVDRFDIHNQKKSDGITLIELVIVVTIIGILAAFGYPSFVEQIGKSRRADATTALTSLAAELEGYYNNRETYLNAGNDSITGIPTITALLGGTLTEHEHYQLSYTARTTNSFTIRAVPQGSQATDLCGTFITNSIGQRTVSGTGDCW